MIIQRKVIKIGGSLGIIIGNYEVKNNEIVEGDTLIIDIVKIKKENKK